MWKQVACRHRRAALDVFLCGEKGMAVHSSTLAWRIPWTEGRLQSIRLQAWDTTEHARTPQCCSVVGPWHRPTALGPFLTSFLLPIPQGLSWGPLHAPGLATEGAYKT